MNKYVLITGDFVETGGMDRANLALAEYLARRGDEVHLVTHRAAADLSKFENVKIHLVPKPLNSYLLGAPLLDRAGRVWAGRLAKAGARVVVNGGNCRFDDVNWVHYVHAAWSPRSAGSWPRRIKAILSRRHDLAVERFNLSRARKVIVNSQRTRRDLIERLAVDPKRIEVVYYGVDAERFRPASEAERLDARAEFGWTDDRPVAVFVGALGDRRKGFDTLFETWRLLAADSKWTARLAVIGTGAMVPYWQARAAETGLDRSIEFLGFRRDVPRILRACDLLISPTRYEAYGLNVQEALACGIPAFVSRDSGIAERYPESLRELLIDDPDDAENLALRLRRWTEQAQDENLRAEIARFSELIRENSWDEMAARIVASVEASPLP